MELVDNKDVETIVALCWDRSHQTDPIQLFAKLANVEPIEEFALLGEEHKVQDLCTVVPRAFVDRRSIICGININPNASPASENINLGPRLQIHLGVIEIDADGDDGYDNNDPSNHEVEDDNDLDLDEVPIFIDDKGANNDRNVNAY
ncbi:hypothetical protein J1N35_019048 [Gossypium stocksii]|uniref:Uncharacterized protein n=1 Tax=Gossypium stocksii TaxID=47602 RepID=A0A9D3VQ44_9ROSI|nr:hypothetical protein J1N35_019048 [Gossypium stocksii]